MAAGPTPHAHVCISCPLHQPAQVGVTRTDDPEEEQAQKRLKSLLNKITKDNFAKITGQVRGSCFLHHGGRSSSARLPRPSLLPAATSRFFATRCNANRRSLRLPPALQIVEVINERKLAITLSGFINQIFDKASPCHAAPEW